METIKVNMSPNPLDVQTIHASQNDNEAREWGFELHNNGDVIDSSEITDQMVFKAYKGGTEEILPTNGSVPVTAPFLGDIRYPQGLLTDQEFTYRESPTEKDGNAKIKNLYGNTLVWNQLQKATANTSTVNGITYTNNGDGSWTVSGTATASAQKALTISADWITAISGHKYLMLGGLPNGGSSRWLMQLYKNNTNTLVGTDSGNGLIYTADDTTLNLSIYFTVYNGNTVNGRIYPQIFDLTKMGLDSITSVSEFTSLFPLSYYEYNAGSMLSFNGTALKITGKNLFNINNYRSMDSAWTLTDGVLESNNNNYKNYVSETIVGTGNRYNLSFKYNVSQNRTYAIQIYNRTDAVQLRRIEFQSTLTSYSINDVLESGKEYDIRVFGYSASSGTIKLYDVQLEIGSTATDYAKYIEPFNLSLPISLYFPTGMKRAGAVYDELTDNKAITRVGAVDLGTLNWSQRLIGTTPIGMQTNGLSATIKNPSTNNDIANIISTAGTASSWTIAMGGNSSSGLMAVSGGYLFIATTETNPTAFKTAMSGVYLNYELATPTETSFTTASLVTENAEIPLSNNDGVLIGKCTEELSAEPGFIDAKIKLSDSDGECYSNKIQLHIERSPQ